MSYEVTCHKSQLNRGVLTFCIGKLTKEKSHSTSKAVHLGLKPDFPRLAVTNFAGTTKNVKLLGYVTRRVLHKHGIGRGTWGGSPENICFFPPVKSNVFKASAAKRPKWR